LSFTDRSAHTSAAYLFYKKIDGFSFQIPTLMLFLKENLIFFLKFSFQKTENYSFNYKFWPSGSFEEWVLNNIS